MALASVRKWLFIMSMYTHAHNVLSVDAYSYTTCLIHIYYYLQLHTLLTLSFAQG
jgi:hypothetical protein